MMKNTAPPPQEKTQKNTNASSEMVKAALDAPADLREFFTDSLQGIYWAENPMLSALPKRVINATSSNLMIVIKEHTALTKMQIVRLEQVFTLIGKQAMGKKCEEMAIQIKEGESILKGTVLVALHGAGTIAASQKIAHYEIATYGTLCAFAKTLGENAGAKLLTETLDEEKNTDLLCSNVAYNAINFDAFEEHIV